eukprot:8247639-Heterocapsa_arctica.AAC.1
MMVIARQDGLHEKAAVLRSLRQSQQQFKQRCEQLSQLLKELQQSYTDFQRMSDFKPGRQVTTKAG